MATKVYTPKPKRAAAMGANPTVNTSMTKTVTFAVPVGLVAGTDTICLRDFLVKGTEVVGAWAKSSVSQGTSTWAIGAYTKGTDAADASYTTGSIQSGAAAFVSAVAVTQTSIMQKLTIVPGTAGVNSVIQDNCDLNIVLGTANSVAATVTLTIQYVSVDAVDNAQTTYTI